MLCELALHRGAWLKARGRVAAELHSRHAVKYQPKERSLFISGFVADEMEADGLCLSKLLMQEEATSLVPAAVTLGRRGQPDGSMGIRAATGADHPELQHGGAGARLDVVAHRGGGPRPVPSGRAGRHCTTAGGAKGPGPAAHAMEDGVRCGRRRLGGQVDAGPSSRKPARCTMAQLVSTVTASLGREAFCL